MNAKPPAIEVVRVTKLYRPPWSVSSLWRRARPERTPTVALANVTLAIRAGEIVGLVGANGSGKSTLLKILATLVLPTAGEVRVNGHDVEKQELTVKRQVGLVSAEDRSFYWRLTGRQNLAFFAALHGLSPREAGSRIEELSALLDLEALDRRVQSYSTGMKQRLQLARALLHDPPVLLLDEPTKSLDPPTAERLRTFLRERAGLRDTRTVLLATHNLLEAEQLCDRIVLLQRGRCLASGTVAELRAALGGREGSLEQALVDLMNRRD